MNSIVDVQKTTTAMDMIEKPYLKWASQMTAVCPEFRKIGNEKNFGTLGAAVGHTKAKTESFECF